MEKRKVVFLYTELAAYFLSCVESLIKTHDIEVHIIRWDVNREAPFKFSFPVGVQIYNRNDYSGQELQELINKIRPDIIYVSGWIDKGYLKICKKYRNEIPVIVGFDNQWKGTLKQQFIRLISPFKILNHFSHCWIPGKPQEEYAKKLGFKNENILTGFYCCDFDFFHSQFLLNKEQKKEGFPKRFLYVGRYIQHKGITDLWKAFIDLQKEFPNDWELWCVGTGDIEPFNHPKIKHFGFVQPDKMKDFIKNTGVFVLPSHFEPWGVVIHEFASAGFPIICTDEVGAGSAFVENNINGYIYESGNTEALKKVLKKIIISESSELLSMADKSVEKAKQILPEKWSAQLLSVLYE